MKDRIKALRKALGLSQGQFAEALGMSISSAQKWEIAAAIPSSATVKLMAERFGASEEWIRSGAGEMFEPRTREEEIAAFVHEVCGPEGTAFQRRLISLLARLTVDEWAILERIADKLSNEKEP